MEVGTLAELVQNYTLNADIVAWDEFQMKEGVNYIINSDPSIKPRRCWIFIRTVGVF